MKLWALGSTLVLLDLLSRLVVHLTLAVGQVVPVTHRIAICNVTHPLGTGGLMVMIVMGVLVPLSCRLGWKLILRRHGLDQSASFHLFSLCVFVLTGIGLLNCMDIVLTNGVTDYIGFMRGAERMTAINLGDAYLVPCFTGVAFSVLVSIYQSTKVSTPGVKR